MTNSITIVAGDKADYPLQTWIRGGLARAVYSAGDFLRAYCYQGKSTTALFIPAVGWYTANGAQLGYTQGQVMVRITNAQCALMVPMGLYTVAVQWAPAAAPTDWAGIVRIKLVVEPVGVLA